MKKLPFEVVQIDQDLDPTATWGDYATFDEARDVFNALVNDKPDDADHGFAVRHHNKSVLINPPAGTTTKVVKP